MIKKVKLALVTTTWKRDCTFKII